MIKADAKAASTNARTAAVCLGVVVGMVGLSFASVPLYRLFCQVTGFAGTTQRADAAPTASVSDREIAVRFDANVSGGLTWSFAPVKREVSLGLGETMQIAYRAQNTSNEPMTGTATFNVTPLQAGAYFNKIECFCFTETTLAPGESLDMPVVFFIDPELVDEEALEQIKTITLSYTFFAVDEPQETAAAALDGPGPAGEIVRN